MFGFNNPIVQQDLKDMARLGLQWNEFQNRTILITGANSMLGTYMAYLFLFLNLSKKLNTKVVVLTRSLDKTKELYQEFLSDSNFFIINQDIIYPIHYIGRIDFIFHFAGNASPKFIKSDPVGILQSNLLGTFNIMELARDKEPQRIIFASTREVYGAVKADSIIEDLFGSLNPMENRSCYPESKRAAESIIRSYYLQYKINSISVRIAHCYGPGMKIDNDGRVMADFISDAVYKRDIVLNSSGDAIRSFCYITDAIIGLIQVCLYGKIGEAYNLANEKEPITVRNLAYLVSNIMSNQNKIVFSNNQSQEGYCSFKRVPLNTKKIENLGFIPQVSLTDGIFKTIRSFTLDS